MRIKILAVVAVVVMVGGAVCLVTDFFGAGDNDRSVQTDDSSKGKKPRREARRKRTKKEAVKEWRESREKPVIEIDERSERLSAMEKELMKALQKAIDSDDFDAVVAAIAQMKKHAMEKEQAAGGRKNGASWLSHLPASMKQAAINALSWFGSDAILELMDFMMDSDADIAQDATTQFELAMQDATLADYERAEVIKRVCSAITDTDTLDWLLITATDARHSVGVDTIIYIAENGTPEAKAMLPEYIELFTGEDGIQTPSDLKKWLDENPDDPDDEDFYGRMVDE